MRNRRRECEIASKCTKTAGQVLANIAKQTVTPALVTYFEGAKKINAVAYCYLVSVYAKLTLHTLQFADNGTLHFFFRRIFFDYDTLYLVQCFSTTLGIWPVFEMQRGMWPGYIFFSF